VARGPPNEAVKSYRETFQHNELDPIVFARALALPDKEFNVLEVRDLIPDSERESLAARIERA
jgi:hypothetical protein